MEVRSQAVCDSTRVQRCFKKSPASQSVSPIVLLAFVDFVCFARAEPGTTRGLRSPQQKAYSPLALAASHSTSLINMLRGAVAPVALPLPNTSGRLTLDPLKLLPSLARPSGRLDLLPVFHHRRPGNPAL